MNIQNAVFETLESLHTNCGCMDYECGQGIITLALTYALETCDKPQTDDPVPCLERSLVRLTVYPDAATLPLNPLKPKPKRERWEE
jgi:hypothetical protein